MFDPLFSSPAPRRVARIALPVPIDSLFDYALPADLAVEPRAGCRALVPFAGRRLTGVIVEVGDAEDPAREPRAGRERGRATLACIERIVDPEPALSAEMISMLREAAVEVFCPVGMALAAALPPGTAPRIVRRQRLTRRGEHALESGAMRGEGRRVLEALAGNPLAPATLSRRFPRDRDLVRDLERDGLIECASLEEGPSAKEKTERMVSVPEGLAVETVCTEQLGRARRQAELLRRVARDGTVATAVLAAEHAGNGPLVRTLIGRGFLVESRRAAPRDVLGDPVERDRPLDLSGEQETALAPIAEAIRAGRCERFLLHGVTGSGKTEVYLRAVAEALARGRQALILVPEITLTHQIVARLRARFGDELAILHSGLSQGERLEQWQRLRRGDTPIAVGARSALFAPLEELGVIVIDEEHDSAYKNEEGFRYRAHNLAARRAEQARCPLVLGSATPSLETRFAAERGEITRLVLERRVAGRPLPAVEIVDLARERDITPRDRRSVLTHPLHKALAETLNTGGQAILFLNRRGFSTQIYCFDCGYAERCESCDVALVFHAASHQLRCHYCDFHKPPPEKCGGCGATGTVLLGVGTERLEEEVQALFPEARIVRLDRDKSQRKGYTESVLRALHSGDANVLVGTQMVAKGHDFPGVRLVGVIAADQGLHMPDFRAAERSFQLLTQVAGRAGRSEEPGRVILQTFVPDHYAIRPVQDHDYEHFYRTELEHRRALAYPPFGRITQVIISAVDEESARGAAESLAEQVRALRPADAEPGEPGAAPEGHRFEVLGPAPAPLARLRGRFRYQLLIKGSDVHRVRRASELLARALARLPREVHAALDADPVSML